MVSDVMIFSEHETCLWVGLQSKLAYLFLGFSKLGMQRFYVHCFRHCLQLLQESSYLKLDVGSRREEVGC